MANLKDRLIKNSTISLTNVFTETGVYKDVKSYPTEIPMINVALSGKIEGGLKPGLLTLSGPSKHFKTLFSLVMASAFLEQEQDGIVLFYDSEFGSPDSYFDKFGIDKERVIHTPITDIEVLKHDIVNQLKEINEKDPVMIIVDSIGNLASKKELDDAEEGKTVADMSRAKALKSLFRMVTPHLAMKKIPMVVINHTYKEMSMYPRDIVSGGTGIMYSSNDVWIIGRQQEKDGKDVTGYNFIINIEKSRSVKEKSKIPITVTWEAGIKKWSGMFDFAIECELIESPSSGWYTVKGSEERFRRKDKENDDEFWKNMIKHTDLMNLIKERYQV